MTRDIHIARGRIQGWMQILCWDVKTSRYFVGLCDADDCMDDEAHNAPVLPAERDDEAAKVTFRDWIDTKNAGYVPEPDWEAQARYDEAHGTVNGYDPVIEAWKTEFANEVDY